MLYSVNQDLIGAFHPDPFGWLRTGSSLPPSRGKGLILSLSTRES